MEDFLAFLEYLYTDHAPIEEGDSVGILVLSNQYVMKRLTSLCELYITKLVDRACAKSIAEADVDVIGMYDECVRSCMQLLSGKTLRSILGVLYIIFICACKYLRYLLMIAKPV